MSDQTEPDALNESSVYWKTRADKLAAERDEQRQRADRYYRALSRFTDPELPPVNGVLVVRVDDGIRLYREGHRFQRQPDGSLFVFARNESVIAVFDGNEWAVAEFVFSPAGDHRATVGGEPGETDE